MTFHNEPTDTGFDEVDRAFPHALVTEDEDGNTKVLALLENETHAEKMAWLFEGISTGRVVILDLASLVQVDTPPEGDDIVAITPNL